MLGSFGAIGSKLGRILSVNVENLVYRLHFQITTVMLLTFGLITISDPIARFNQSPSIPANVMDQCGWVSTTFTLHTQTSHSVAARYLGVSTTTKIYSCTYNPFHQWRFLILFLQAIIFCGLRLFWKKLIDKQQKEIVSGLETCLEEKQVKIIKVCDYLRKRFGQNNSYLAKFIACEVLNFVNVVLQLSFTNIVLNDATDVISYSDLNQKNGLGPMTLVFPRLTKCTFQSYGPSGGKHKHDALCILPLNIIAEKIYSFLSIWFFALALVSGATLMYRIITLSVPKFRLVLLQVRSRICVKEINYQCSIGDWFFIYRLGCSIDRDYFSEIISNLANNPPTKDGKKDVGTEFTSGRWVTRGITVLKTLGILIFITSIIFYAIVLLNYISVYFNIFNATGTCLQPNLCLIIVSIIVIITASIYCHN